MECTKKLSRSPEARTRYLEEFGSSFLYLPSAGETVSLDPIGSLLWKLCDGRRDLKEVCQEVEVLWQDQGISETQIRTDVENFVSRLVTLGFLEWSE